MAHPTWMADPPPTMPITALGWCRLFWRVLALVLVLLIGLALLGCCRLIEWPLVGPRRPASGRIVQGVCRVALVVLGIRYTIKGRSMTAPGGVVANHASWLDILALNAGSQVFFVSKAEVAGWPGIGWLAKVAGTVFIARSSAEAKRQRSIFVARLNARHRLLFFPEGTSTDGRRVLPFKSTLFAAFFDPAIRKDSVLQPATVYWQAPPGHDPRFFGWWGEMDFGPHFVQVLAAPGRGRVTVTYHDPIAVREASDRKSLAKACEQAVRSGLPVG